MSSDGKYEKIAVLDNEFEAQMLESILIEREIPYHLKSYHDTAFDGLYQTQKGWGHISSPAENAEEINAVLAELRSATEETFDIE